MAFVAAQAKLLSGSFGYEIKYIRFGFTVVRLVVMGVVAIGVVSFEA